MSALSDTYAWAQEYSIDAISQALQAAAPMPLVAVGSGGSMTTASWLAYLYRKTFRAVAHTTTPLGLGSQLPIDGRASVWLLTASGRNRDILRGFDTALLAEPQQLVVLAAAEESPLSEKAADHPGTVRMGFCPPAGRDGFLATNSLFATCVLLARASIACDKTPTLPRTLDELLNAYLPGARSLADIDAACTALWQKNTLIVLHGTVGHVAAIDIESRFTEAALGCVQVADVRNFGHGRHHWLAKRSAESAVLALIEPEIADLAEQTLQLLPSEVPVARFVLADDSVGTALAGVYLGLRLAEAAGRAHGIDPGRPGVPDFGRRIYHLRPPKARRPGLSGGQSASGEVPAAEGVAIERKAGMPLPVLAAQGTLDAWRKAYAQLRETLTNARIDALVFDYDGTLVTRDSRYAPPTEPVVEALVQLLERGLSLGIATGRGDSVRRDLQKALPRTLWPAVVIGYRNGSELGTLDRDDIPDDADAPCDELAAALAAWASSPFVTMTDVRVRAKQVTITSRVPMPEGGLWEVVMEMLGNEVHECRVVRSSHSVDILAPGVSKCAVVEYLTRHQTGDSATVLRIGDRGRWPGNDFALLDAPLGLSVDEVSRRPDGCWNLAPAGERGMPATIRYLGWLTPASKRNPSVLRLRLPRGPR